MRILNKIISSILIISLAACNRPPAPDDSKVMRKVSAETFSRQYKKAHLLHTMHDIKYLGLDRQYAYIRIRHMSLTDSKKWRTEIIYSELSQLSAGLRQQLLKTNKHYSRRKR